MIPGASPVFLKTPDNPLSEVYLGDEHSWKHGRSAGLVIGISRDENDVQGRFVNYRVEVGRVRPASRPAFPLRLLARLMQITTVRLGGSLGSCTCTPSHRPRTAPDDLTRRSPAVARCPRPGLHHPHVLPIRHP